ncbi:MAG TPA: hypothetical protein VIW46_06625 [Acidimicrobiia bacterium]|jgi:hypothetical protein
MAGNQHFVTVDTLDAAVELLTFRPLVPMFTSGSELRTRPL